MTLRTNTLLLAGLLTLSACTTSPTPPTQPQTGASTKAALGVYELSLSGDGKTAKQASVRAQANEVGGLSFQSVQYGYTVDSQSNSTVAYATFDVTNNSGTDITAPTLVPIDTAGTGGTVGYTAFRELKTFGGADASSKAAGLTYTQGTNQQGHTTPLVTSLDSGSITGINTGTTQLAGTARSGWVMPALSSGATGRVTVAIRIPGTDAQQNPFSFNMVFTVADSVPVINTLTNIGAVQGTTPSGDAASPLSGQTVTVEGVVTSVHTANVTGSYKGFYVQEEGMDADTAVTTSDGVFVYCNTDCPTTLQTGERVRVTGAVSEFSTGTQITTTTAQVTRFTPGLALPDAQALTLPLAFSDRERYEGMRVSTSGVVTNNFTLGRGASFDIADARIMNYTQVNAPSVTGNAAYQTEVKNRYIRVDDGIRAQNPDPEIFARNGQTLSAANTLRGGDNVTVTGVLGFSNDGWSGSGSLDTYRIHATQTTVSVTDGNPRLAAPEAVGGALRVGSMNVLNYFTTLVNTNDGCTPNGTDSGARGANNCEEFLRQQSKIVKAILGLNSDVLGLLEIQNDFDKGANSSVANLVNALNTEVGAGTYAYVNPGAKVGGDAISVAMIYKTATVDPVGTLAILDNSVTASYTDTCNRPTWAQTFQSKANGGRVTAVMLHLKSKGSACAATSDADTGDGQGNGYIARRNAATALVNWLNTNPTGITEDDRILMGDYNAYAMEEPLTILANGGYTNLFDKNVYSYQFDGQWGSLDQAVGSASLLGQVAGKTKWHINADEPTVLDYNTEFKSATQKTSFFAADPFRSSDHDPILVGLNLTAQTPLPIGAPAAAIGLTTTTSAVSVTAGQSTTNTVNVNRTSYTGDVTLTTSVSGTGTQPVITVTTQPGTGNAGTINVDATNATAGTYTVSVTGSGTGVSDATTTFTVNVTPAIVAGTPWVNEISYDSTATNDLGDEYVEVIVPAGYDVSKLSLVLYNGNGGAVYRTDLFVNNATANTTVTKSTINSNYDAYLFNFGGTGNIFQNGDPDGVAICNDTTLVQFLSYDGTFTGVGGCAGGVASTAIAVSQPNSTAPGNSLQLSGTGNKYSDFTWNAPAAHTKGAVNNGQTLN
ncbi:ExeM/NucH family extracellular endonuclease [Deinococcus ficus]|uniref:ExeM/NucH family extracellular endonuclease n=1 Tax=Deinococcus ficus TaxID=317577 RepID=UPI00040F2200|nr:ExeM/NucH family extracellular endonuclease [Deinococcus ficus]